VCVAVITIPGVILVGYNVSHKLHQLESGVPQRYVGPSSEYAYFVMVGAAALGLLTWYVGLMIIEDEYGVSMVNSNTFKHSDGFYNSLFGFIGLA
jgi:hypothetical protein